MKNKFFQFLIFFFLIFFTMQLLGLNEQPQDSANVQDIELQFEASEVTLGNAVNLQITNNLSDSITLPNDCPNEPLDVFQYENGEWLEKSATAESATCEDRTIAPAETQVISYGPWKSTLFDDYGKYKVEYPIEIDGKEKVFSKEVEIVEAGFFMGTWNALFYKPIYNGLIFLVSIMPQGQNLGLAVILLTLLIKLVLLVPNNKAIRSQRELQKVQPLLEEIKSKYAGNQQKIAEETMKVWKGHKINPFGSCLPLLIQFPIMIALFYVVKDGLVISENLHLLYSFLRDQNIVIAPMFLGLLDLTIPNVFVLPLIVGGLQFIQMKLSFAKAKVRMKGKSSAQQQQMQVMNNTMTYVLPVMIAVFTASLPAAVGLYWGVSTLFAIGQQYVMNKKVG